MKKKLILILAAVMFIHSQHEAKSDTRRSTINLKPKMMTYVNSMLPGNVIHWCQNDIDSDIVALAKLSAEETMVSVIQGDYEYTIYRFAYEVTKEIKGKLPAPSLTFYVERKFPTPESGIKYKELWPFRNPKGLKFSIDISSPHFIIRDICLNTSA